MQVLTGARKSLKSRTTLLVKKLDTAGNMFLPLRKPKIKRSNVRREECELFKSEAVCI